VEEIAMETPALKRLIGAYVNEDWPEFYDDVWAAVDDFIESAPVLASSLPSDIETVLREFPTDAGLERYLDELGVGYQPQTGDAGFRAWLIQVSRRTGAPTL
jgi:CdiI immunity protein